MSGDVSKYELQHAIRYATEATRIDQFHRWRAKLPEVFQFAHLARVPADSEKDYYVPASLKPNAFVVTRTWFDEDGCNGIACFPFRDNLDPCKGAWREREVRIGTQYFKACQPACEWSTIDTEFRDSKCFLVNIQKKQLAMAPEKIYGMKSKHNFHSGLDLIKGHLKLNSKYCYAYGLDFFDGDCYESIGQKVSEIFIGSNIFRSVKRKIVRVPVPAPLILAPARRRRAVAAAVPPIVQPPEEFEPNDTTKQLVYDLALEFSAEMGVDVTLNFVANVLRKKVPGMVVKAAIDLPIKSALLQAVSKSYAVAIATGVKALGTAAKVANVALLGYGVFSLVLDLFDPYEFNKVLTKKRLEEIDLALDQLFFERSKDFKIEVTPEFLWDYVLTEQEGEEDETERFTFFADKVREYLEALRQVPPKPESLKPIPQQRNDSIPKVGVGRTSVIQWICVLMVVIWAVMLPDLVHWWALSIFFIMVLTHSFD